jgi:FMN phosphatase YigB (HAD superfamily)
MYKSIVFDLGGVMIDFDPRGYLVDRLCNAETEEEVYDLTFGSEEWKLLDAGLISRFDGNHRMLEKARAAGRAFEVQGVLDDWPAPDGRAGAPPEEPRLLRVLPEQHPAGCAGPAPGPGRAGRL